MRWLLYIKIVCGNKKNLVLTHSNFYIFVFLVLKGDVVEMNETDKGKNNNDSNILENSMLNIDNPNYLKGKDFINRASIINNRPTRTSTVYELEGNPKNSKEVLKFIKTNKDSLGLHSISIVKEKNAEEGVEEDNKINNKDKNEENKNLKILIETCGKDANEFENKFNEWKKKNPKSNTATAAYNAGYILTMKYEVPADTTNQAKKRGKTAKNMYSIMTS